MIQSHAQNQFFKSVEAPKQNKKHLTCIYDNIRKTAPVLRPPRRLPADFVPSNYDVICAKGKKAFNSVGNRRFRIIIETHLNSYQTARTKHQKTAIVNSIVEIIRQVSTAGFIKIDEEGWMEVGDAAAREKVGQTIRDILSQRDPVKRAKKMIRQQAKKRKDLEQLQLQKQQPEIATSVTDLFSKDFDTSFNAVPISSTFDLVDRVHLSRAA